MASEARGIATVEPMPIAMAAAIPATSNATLKDCKRKSLGCCCCKHRASKFPGICTRLSKLVKLDAKAQAEQDFGTKEHLRVDKEYQRDLFDRLRGFRKMMISHFRTVF